MRCLKSVYDDYNDDDGSSSPCEPNGSCEIKVNNTCVIMSKCMKRRGRACIYCLLGFVVSTTINNC